MIKQDMENMTRGLLYLSEIMSIRLEINHPASSKEVVPTRCVRSTGDDSVVDVAVEVIELHTGVRIPPPVQTEREAITNTTKDVVVGEIAM